MRCVEMNRHSQRAPCFLSNLFSVAMQLKTSLLARTMLFSACDAILQVCPAEGWVMGMHTQQQAQKTRHVYVHTGGDTHGQTWTCACLRACIYTYTHRHHLSSAKAGRRKTLHFTSAQGMPCMRLLFYQPHNDDKSRWVTETFTLMAKIIYIYKIFKKCKGGVFYIQLF